jgi:hypothetical protein
LNEDAGVMAANREQSCSNSCDSAEEKLITLAERFAGMVQAYVGQKLLKRDILRVFMMSDS